MVAGMASSRKIRKDPEKYRSDCLRKKRDRTDETSRSAEPPKLPLHPATLRTCGAYHFDRPHASIAMTGASLAKPPASFDQLLPRLNKVISSPCASMTPRSRVPDASR